MEFEREVFHDGLEPLDASRLAQGEKGRCATSAFHTNGSRVTDMYKCNTVTMAHNCTCQTALTALSQYSHVCMHSEAPDPSSHTKDGSRYEKSHWTIWPPRILTGPLRVIRRIPTCQHSFCHVTDRTRAFQGRTDKITNALRSAQSQNLQRTDLSLDLAVFAKH